MPTRLADLILGRDHTASKAFPIYQNPMRERGIATEVLSLAHASGFDSIRSGSRHLLVSPMLGCYEQPTSLTNCIKFLHFGGEGRIMTFLDPPGIYLRTL